MSDDTLSPTITPVKSPTTGETSTEALPTTAADRYVIDRELGQGGQSVVFAAKDSSLGRDVALKTARQKGDAANAFVREARITGQLEHPGIVPVHELGRTSTGDIYCTQKLVRGRTFRAALDEAQTLEARLALLPHFIDLCHAVAYAHSRGVVHRDLKPENVMVGEFGETVVLDWGIARVLGAADELPAESAQPEQVKPHHTVRRLDGVISGSTQRGSVIGTPLYMSPEQARGENDHVDARSDVWSLGVMLYELLAFTRPFDGTEVRALLAEVGRGHYRPLLDVAPEAPPELVAIVAQALQLDRDRRYADARALAAQLADFRAGKRVAAYQYTSWELAKRFVTHNRALTAVSLVGLVVLGASDFQAWRLVDARDRSLDTARARHAADLEARALAAERTLDWNLASALLREEATPRALLHDALLAPWVTPPTRDEREVPTPATGAGCLDLDSGRALLATAGGLFSVHGEQPWRLLENTSDPERHALPSALARGGERWLLKSGTLRLVTAQDPSGVALPGTEQAQLAVFSPDAARVGVALAYAVRVHDGQHGALTVELTDAPFEPTALTLSDEGALAVAGADGTLRWWRTADGSPTKHPLLFGRRVVALSFSLDGRLLFAGDEEGHVQVLVAETGQLVRLLSGHRLPVQALVPSPDGRTLATSSADGVVLLWDLATWTVLAKLQAGGREVRALSYSADGAALGALDRAGQRTTWPVGKLLAARPVGVLEDGPATGVLAAKGGGAWVRTATGLGLLSPDGDVLWRQAGVRGGEALVTELGLLVGKPGQLDLHSTVDGAVLETTRPCRATVWSVVGEGEDVWLACGTELLTASGESTGVRARSPMRHLARSPKGDRLAWAAEDGSGGLVSLPALHEEESWTGKQGHALAFDAQGRWLLTAGEDGVVLRSAETGFEAKRLSTVDLHVAAVGFFVVNEVTVAWAAAGDGVHVWTLDDGAPLLTLPGLFGELTAAAPTDDGRGLWLADTTGRVFLHPLQ